MINLYHVNLCTVIMIYFFLNDIKLRNDIVLRNRFINYFFVLSCSSRVDGDKETRVGGWRSIERIYDI